MNPKAIKLGKKILSYDQYQNDNGHKKSYTKTYITGYRIKDIRNYTRPVWSASRTLGSNMRAVE